MVAISSSASFNFKSCEVKLASRDRSWGKMPCTYAWEFFYYRLLLFCIVFGLLGTLWLPNDLNFERWHVGVAYIDSVSGNVFSKIINVGLLCRHKYREESIYSLDTFFIFIKRINNLYLWIHYGIVSNPYKIYYENSSCDKFELVLNKLFYQHIKLF